MESPRYTRKRNKTRRIEQYIGGDRRKHTWAERKSTYEEKKERYREMWRKKNEEAPDYKEGEEYTKTELGLMADAILREDARSEICRTCDEPGDKTGKIKVMEQADEQGKPITDEQGNRLKIEFPEYVCPSGHSWYQGEGRAKGIGGDNPILFEEHIANRRRREIHPTEGVPDPAVMSLIQAPMYNRVHEGGRKVNSPEARRKSGASFYR